MTFQQQLSSFQVWVVVFFTEVKFITAAKPCRVRVVEALNRTEQNPLCDTQVGRVAAFAPGSWLEDVVSSR